MQQTFFCIFVHDSVLTTAPDDSVSNEGRFPDILNDSESHNRSSAHGHSQNVTVFHNMQGKLVYTDELVTKKIKDNTVYIYGKTLHSVRLLTIFVDHPQSPSSYAERANDEETTE